MKANTNGGGKVKYKYAFNIVPLLMGFFLFLQSCSTVTNSNPLIGKTSFEEWKKSKYWNEPAYLQYDPNSQALGLFRRLYSEDKFKLIIFASIYCDDCLMNVPQLARITESIKIPAESLLFYGLDEYSTEPSGFYKKYKFDKTPAVFIEYPSGELIKIEKGPDWLEAMNYVLGERSLKKALQNGK